jgi:hypothetical protein
MRLSFLVCLLLVESLWASVILNLNQAQYGAYSQWKSQYVRSYASGEVESYHLSLWLQTYSWVNAHNAQFEQGLISYSV